MCVYFVFVSFEMMMMMIKLNEWMNEWTELELKTENLDYSHSDNNNIIIMLGLFSFIPFDFQQKNNIIIKMIHHIMNRVVAGWKIM